MKTLYIEIEGHQILIYQDIGSIRKLINTNDDDKYMMVLQMLGTSLLLLQK